MSNFDRLKIVSKFGFSVSSSTACLGTSAVLYLFEGIGEHYIGINLSARVSNDLETILYSIKLLSEDTQNYRTGITVVIVLWILTLTVPMTLALHFD